MLVVAGYPCRHFKVLSLLIHFLKQDSVTSSGEGRQHLQSVVLFRMEMTESHFHFTTLSFAPLKKTRSNP